MEEHLAVCEDHLRLRTKEVERLTLEVNSFKKKVGLVVINSCSANE